MERHTAVDTGELEDRFAQFIRCHRRTMRRYFQSVGMFNGHPYMLMVVRRHPGITQKELAAQMEISPPSVAISVRRLEGAGLITRQTDPHDRRATRLYLTPAGEEMDAACARGRDFLIDTQYRGLTPAEQATLYDLLGKMMDNLQTAATALPEPPDGKDLIEP